jgi:phospholipase/carboxylesterase
LLESGEDLPDNTFLYYVVQEPVKTSELGKSPLLVLLHGYGSNEEDLFSLAAQLDGRLFAASLRAPIDMGYDAYSWGPISVTPSGASFDIAEIKKSLELVKRTIEDIVLVYDLDPKQVYVMGFSQGAALTLALTLSTPEMVAGAVVMSGRRLPEIIDEAAEGDLEELPIFVAHGINDDVLPISDGRAIRDHLSTLPVRLDYHEYSMGHTVSVESFFDIAQWFIARLNEADHLKA